MSYTQRFTELWNEIGVLRPASYNSVQYTAWVNVAKYRRIVALLNVGTISSNGTLDAKFQQASDSTGTGVKDVSGKAITQLTQAGSDSNKSVRIELRSEELDTNNGFEYIRLAVTPAVAAAIVGAQVLGGGDSGRYLPQPTTAYDEVVD